MNFLREKRALTVRIPKIMPRTANGVFAVGEVVEVGVEVSVGVGAAVGVK